MSSEAGTRLFDYDGTFFQGAKSDCDPSQLPLGYCWTALNMINLGGVLSCRPGNRCLVALPDGNLQGATLFRPAVGLEQLLVAIDGVIYVAPYPFLEFTVLSNVLFSPDAQQIFWAQCTQVAERNTPGSLLSAITVIPNKQVLIMQDGGRTAPAYYDGSQSGHIRDYDFQTPVGGPMVWVGSRLWVAQGNLVFTSDVGNPFSFVEQIYLGGASAFIFSGDVTAMVKTPSIEAPQLMVFTATDGSILEANIQDRSQWPSTVDFQREVVQVGCHSNRSIVSHYGQLIWFSPSGVVIYDPATAGKLTARLPVRDNEMMFSKTTLNDNLGLVASGVFGQFVAISVPAADIQNQHTWVLNHASLETLNDASGPSWCGHWTGTNPVEWVYGQIANAERIYHVSKDSDGTNRLWESFRPERLDNGCPITWAFTTRAHFGQTCPVPSKIPGARCRLQFIDISLVGISEDLDLGAFYAGGTRGGFRQFLAKKLLVSRGCLNNSVAMDANTSIFSFKPQSRVERSEDANQKTVDDAAGGCGVERTDLDNIDDSFQYLVVGHGPATVRFVRSFALSVPEDKSGESGACVDESEFNAVRFDGVAIQGTDPLSLAAELASIDYQHFTSNQTVTITQSGLSSVGVGFAESIVTQEAADRVAQIIATKRAEAALQLILPRTVSVGLDLEPL